MCGRVLGQFWVSNTRRRQAPRANPARAGRPKAASIADTGPCRDACASPRTAAHRPRAFAARAGRAAELWSPPSPASGPTPSAARPSRWVSVGLSVGMSENSASLTPPSAPASRSDDSDASTASNVSGVTDESVSTSVAPPATAGSSGCGPMALVGAQGFPSVPFGHTASVPHARTNTERPASIHKNAGTAATRVSRVRRGSEIEQVGQSVKNSSSVVRRCVRLCPLTPQMWGRAGAMRRNAVQYRRPTPARLSTIHASGRWGGCGL